MQQVEGDGGDGEELAGVGDGEADVGDGEAGQVRGAVGEEFGGPDAEHDPCRPGACGVGRGGGDGGGDAPHDGFGVVGELVLGDVSWGGLT